MDDLDDVYEYVRDEQKQRTVVKMDIRRLLKYLKRLDPQETRRQSIAMVHVSAFLLMEGSVF